MADKAPVALREMLRAGRESGGIVAVSVAGMGLTVLLQFVLARLLGTGEFGAYAYALSWLNIFSYLAIFGHDMLLLRELAVHRERGDWHWHGGVWRYAVRFSTVSTVIVALIVLALMLATDMVAGRYYPLVTATMLGLPLLVFVRLHAAAASAEGWPVRGNIPERIGRNVVMFALLAGAMIVGVQLDAVLTMAGFALSTAVAAVLLWLFSRRAGALPLPAGGRASRGRAWFREAGIFGLNGAGQLVLHRTDVVMIGFFLGAEGVGPYVLAAALADLVLFPHAAIAPLFGPRLAVHHGSGRTAEMRATMRRARLFVGGAGIAIGVAALLTGPFMLELAGRDFTAGQAPMMVLVAAQMLRSLWGPVQLALNMAGRQGAALRVVAVMAVANILLNAWLIPAFGLVGAAAATGAVAIVGAMAMSAVLTRALRETGESPAA